MSTIEEVINNLKGAFLDIEFQEAKKVLISREEKLKAKCMSLEAKLKDMQTEIKVHEVIKEEAVQRYKGIMEKEGEVKRERGQVEELRKEIERVRREKGAVEMENKELLRQREDLRKENGELMERLDEVKEQVDKVELEVVGLMCNASLGRLGGDKIGKIVQGVVDALDGAGENGGGGGDGKGAIFDDEAG